MGNSLIFLAEVVSALRELGVRADVLVDGDNALLFVSRGVLALVLREFPRLVRESSGHEVKLERPTSIIEEIRFGGSAPVWCGKKIGWSMVREWNRVLSGAFSSHIHLREPKFAKRWMNGVARCEMSIARGVPVLQSWALGAMHALSGAKLPRADFYRDYFALGAWIANEDAMVPVEDEARHSFARAFGVLPEEQKVMERGFTFSSMDLPWDYRWPKRFEHWMEEGGVHDSWHLV